MAGQGQRGTSPGRSKRGGGGGGGGDSRGSRRLGQGPASRGSSPGNSTGGSLPGSRGAESSSSSDLLEVSATGSLRSPSTPEDNINVVVRVRPLSKRELKSGDNSVVQFPGNGQVVLNALECAAALGGSVRPKVFSYNAVFEPAATQEDVLQYSGVTRLIDMAVDGYSCTCFCYGQTGSGKTHTLTGPPGLFDQRPNPYSEDHGLVFRSFVHLFKLLQERRDCHFVLKASFLEIYNEKVIDLLNPGSARKPLAVRWSKKTRSFFVENLFSVDCETLDDLLAVLEEGMRNRSVGRHNMNEYSSRSHTILTVHITSEQQVGNEGVFLTKQGKINFVDLAGSEMTKKTHSEGKTLEEANNINKSLMVLGYCIASLSDSRKKAGHIPYRDSKLTKLLADSLAGSGVTLMIACISPARSNVTETLNTLRYAARAKKIRTQPIVVMDPREALILSLKREVASLQEENEHLQHALHLHAAAAAASASGSTAAASVAATLAGSADPRSPAPDASALAGMEREELVELARHYVSENAALRRENLELFSTRELLLRDQEVVCRENERLLKKLEDVNSVCCRSPIIPARPAYSAEMLAASINGNGPEASAGGQATGSAVWSSPTPEAAKNNRRSAKPPHRLPDSIQKELERRRIGTSSMTNIADSFRERSHRRHNSWEESGGGGGGGGAGSAVASPGTPEERPVLTTSRNSALSVCR
ncbi:kinesin-like protein KIF12 [Schistocerca gregaria]|uniref:kinesin-like protein KIF12 n=1 Tax=Schistocerca gregaria TaxID=7010 RepID=UPI00211E443B|nr:kinesin-like protein KIF12 [Schistocerca gregaria]